MKPKTGDSKLRLLYFGRRERRWNRDRGRRIAAMLYRERRTLAAKAEWLEGMVIQLVEIRSLPEVREPVR